MNGNIPLFCNKSSSNYIIIKQNYVLNNQKNKKEETIKNIESVKNM